MLKLHEMSWRHVVLFALGFAWLALAHANGTPTIEVIGGGALVVLGEALRIWATGHIRKNEVLTLGGPYRYVRDPMYIGSFLVTTGFMLAGHQIAIMLLFWLMYFGHYMPRKRSKECARLLQIFGQPYADYMASVRSLIPRLTPYKGGAPSRFSWRLCIENNEDGIALLLVTAAALLCIKSFVLKVTLPLPPCLSPWF